MKYPLKCPFSILTVLALLALADTARAQSLYYNSGGAQPQFLDSPGATYYGSDIAPYDFSNSKSRSSEPASLLNLSPDQINALRAESDRRAAQEREQALSNIFAKRGNDNQAYRGYQPPTGNAGSLTPEDLQNLSNTVGNGADYAQFGGFRGSNPALGGAGRSRGGGTYGSNYSGGANGNVKMIYRGKKEDIYNLTPPRKVFNSVD